MQDNMVKTFAVPQNVATKQLQLKKSGERTKVVISSNWLPLFDFNKGDDVREVSLGRGQGFVIERVYDLFNGGASKIKKVYSRSYPRRRNCPLEILLETSKKGLLEYSLPKDCEKVHVVFTHGKVYVRPIENRVSQILERTTPETAYKVFGACTSGIDLVGMEDEGFSVHSILEWRPNEKRDKDRDLTETGALSALRNVRGLENLFNEDVTTIDMRVIEQAVADSPAGIFIASPQCDDFTNLKAKKFKDMHQADLSASTDMAYDMLRLIETIKPALVQFEQVAGWYTSEIYQMVKLRLQRHGYREHLLVGDARDYGGLTSRTRGYAVYTLLPNAFEFEAPVPRRDNPIWDEIQHYLPACREVSENKSIILGAECGRLRVINRESCHSPTFVKSQSRMCKDSVVVEDGGRYFWPTEELMKFLMGIPARYQFDACSQDIGSEILGQSVDGGLHGSVVRAIKRHVDVYVATKAGTKAAA